MLSTFLLDASGRLVSIIGFHLLSKPESDCKVIECQIPDGIKIIENFITDENNLVDIVKSRMKEEGKGDELKQREVLHFGKHFNYKKNWLVFSNIYGLVD